MVAAEKLPYNTQVLRWARERRRLAPDVAAKRASVTPEKVIEWEQGVSAPTVRQARELAALYERPFLEFFSPTLPDVSPLLLVPDYRFQRQSPGELELTALEGVQGWAETQRLNAIDLYEALGEAPPAFPRELRSVVDDDPERVANLARSVLQFPVERQLALKADERPKFPALLRNAIETVGVLVLKQSGIVKLRTRGMCLFHETLPVIVFGNEAPGAQAFTLAHEFGHVMLSASAISGAPALVQHRKGSKQRRIEGWCNSFSAAFLMPAEAVRSHNLTPKYRVTSIPDMAIDAIARSFAVSRHAMMIRLVTLGLVEPAYYWRVKREQFLREEADYEGGGRSKYYGSRYRNSLGDRYTSLVLEALATGRIGAHSASEFMGIKNARHLQDIRDNFGDS